jgi:uncharacterized protein YkwD
MFRKLLMVAALVALAGCETVTPVGAPLPPDPRTQMPALEARIAVLVAEERWKLDPKSKPLAIDPELSHVAHARAVDMAAKNYLAHAAPDGSTSASLLMKVDAKWQGLLGENLAAQHYTRQGGVAVDDFAHRFLDEWLKSPPHRDNMAFADYDRTGVGAAVNGDTVYVALLFSTDMGLPPPRDGAPANAVSSYASPGAARDDRPAVQPDPLRLRGSEGGGR